MADAHVALRTLMLCVRCFYLFIICWTPGPRVLFVKGISPASETSKDTSELFHVPPQLLRNGSRRRLSICFSASCWWLSPTFPWCSLLMSWPRLDHSFHFSTKISSESASASVHTCCVYCVSRGEDTECEAVGLFFLPLGSGGIMEKPSNCPAVSSPTALYFINAVVFVSVFPFLSFLHVQKKWCHDCVILNNSYKLFLFFK